MSAANLATGGGTTYDFTVTYSDNVAINASSLDDSDVLVSGPNGYSQLATRVSVNDTSNGTPRTVIYRITAPGGGTWDGADNGSYSIALQANQVSDVNGNFATAATLGSFLANIPLSAIRFSGGSNGNVGKFSLEINTDILGTPETTNTYRFSGAVRDFSVVGRNGASYGAIDFGSLDLVSSQFYPSSLSYLAPLGSSVKYTATFIDSTLGQEVLTLYAKSDDPANALKSLAPLVSSIKDFDPSYIPENYNPEYAIELDGQARGFFLITSRVASNGT